MSAAVVLGGCKACESPANGPSSTVGEPSPAWTVQGDPARGARWVEHFECRRCHEGLATEPLAENRHCVRCHQSILRGAFEAPPDVLHRWQQGIKSLPAVPSLTATNARFRRDWIAAFLQRPHDLRPRLLAMMPRLEISPEKAADLATYLVPDAPRALDLSGADAERGQQLLNNNACGTCHQFGGAPPIVATPLPHPISAEQMETAQLLAPDLRYTRDRFSSASLVRWLLSPSNVKPDTLMPATGFSEVDARDVAAYLSMTPLAPVPQPAVPMRLPVLERAVPYEEVSERIFRRTCWHCHSDPSYARGDGGPGNTGGFGFAGKAINLASYEQVMSGYQSHDGKRSSLFRKNDEGVPLIVQAMLARHREVAGLPPGPVRGMPLGLPPFPMEDIQLLESWIAQGRVAPQAE